MPFAGAFLAGFLPTGARKLAAGLSLGVALVGLICVLALFPAVAGGGVVRHEISWLPSLGVNIILRLDGLSWLFSTLVLGLGVLVILYARYYMAATDPVPRFFSYLLAFMGAMLGVVISGNVIQLVVFWELTSLFSFLLIGYWQQNAAAREGARMALTVTVSGGLLLLVGMVLLGQIVGSFDLDQILAAGDQIKADPLYLVTLILILAGALTKSAQFPFHFWLPRAMSAPTPVSAYLHSATMVKAGVFLLMLLWPVLAGTPAWYLIVGTVGMVTLLVGAYSAIFQHDLKGLLAYSTISHLGLIMVLLGLGTPLALVAAIFHTVNHATFKASLFMAAGIIDHETGTRDMRRLSGLYRFMPITATLAMVAAAAMAGVPLLNGFLSKEMFLAEALENSGGSYLSYALPVLATVASAFSVLYSLRFIHQTFFGPAPVGLDRIPKEPRRWMRFPIDFLVLACIVVGIFPSLTIGPYLAAAVRAVLGDATPYYSLAIWHGLNAPLLMSLLALSGGVGLYLRFRHVINTNPRGGPKVFSRFNGGLMFDAVMTAIRQGSRRLEVLLGSERLQVQLRAIVVVAILLAFLAGAGRRLVPDQALPVLGQVHPGFLLLWVIGGTCAIAAAWQAKYHRLAAVILMGAAGLASCLTFVWLSAPDLALTQLLVEIVTTVLLLLGLRWLPKRLDSLPDSPADQARSRRRRRLDLVIAATAGIGVALMAFAVMTTERDLTSVSTFFIEHAYGQAGGRNIVNVLLVDFRAFDTFGEIAVLGIVGLTIFALLRRFRPAPESLPQPDQQIRQNKSDDLRENHSRGTTLSDAMLIPRIVVNWLFPVIMVLAVHLFLRGHDLPGGGFAAGMTLAIAFILLYMGSGTRWVEDLLDVRPLVWVGTGLLIAFLTGAGSFVFGYPFLTSYFQYADLPVIGRIPMATAVLFDLGILILVLGSTLLILIALAHQSLRRPRAPLAPKGDRPADSPSEELS